jgi:chitin disaccharide deacetylase
VASGNGAAGPTCRRRSRHPASTRPPVGRRAPLDSVAHVTTVAERLGHPPDARLLIVNCDDLGSCYAANVGVYEALRSGLATSATLMVPCPWAREAAARYRGEDVGVHLTLNAEYDLYRWGPITHAPSLLDGDGGFPRTLADLWDHADLDEVTRECRAQIERAILWGFDVSHLDSHMGALQLRPEFFDVYLEMAVEFALPIRLSGASSERAIGFPFRRLAAAEGVVFPDHLVHVRGIGSREALERTLADLRPGVTEVYLHPAVDAPELRAFATDWASRVDDLDLVTLDQRLAGLVEGSGATLIGYRTLRDLQRAA